MPQQTERHSYEPNENSPRVDVDRVDLKAWLKRSKRWAHNEYVRVIHDRENAELRLYRATAEPGDQEYVATTVEDVRFSFYSGDDRTPIAWNLHASDAMTLLTLLDAFKWERVDHRVFVEWWADSGKGMTEENALTEETLIVGYGPSSSQPKREVIVNSLYEVESQMLAFFDG